MVNPNLTCHHHVEYTYFSKKKGGGGGGELKDGDIQRATQKKAELKVKAILPITGLARTMLFK